MAKAFLTAAWLAKCVAMQDVDRRTVRVRIGDGIWADARHSGGSVEPEVVVTLPEDVWFQWNGDIEQAIAWAKEQARVVFAYPWREVFGRGGIGGCE